MTTLAHPVSSKPGMSRIALSTVLSASALSALTAFAYPTTDSPLWGTLIAGQYAVGYRASFVADRSRTWRARLERAIGNRPDQRGRPIRISMWYPSSQRRAVMRVGDYVRGDGPSTFGDAETALENRDRRVIAEWVPSDALTALMATSTKASRDVALASGQFPLVLYAAGINPYTLSNVVLAEFLASHGIITIAVSSLGPSSNLPEQQYNARELEDSRRDLEFAWSVVRADRHVDPAKLAVVGHSLGGTIALRIAIANPSVRAAVGLDGTYGFGGTDGADAFTTQYDPDRVEVEAAILDIRRSDANIDLNALRKFRRADRYFVTMPEMFHGDFTSFVMGAQAFHLAPPSNARRGWTQADGARGYERVCVGVLEFLHAALGGDLEGFHAWQSEMGHAGASVTHNSPADR